jgi:cobaltochelatase CobN
MKVAPQFNAEFVPNVGSNAAIVRGAAAVSRPGGAAPSAQQAPPAPSQQATDAAMQNAITELQALQNKAQELQPPPAQPPSAKAKPAEPAPQAKTDAQDAKVSGFEMQTLANLTPVQKTVGTLALLALAAALVGVGYVSRRSKLRQV